MLKNEKCLIYFLHSVCLSLCSYSIMVAKTPVQPKSAVCLQRGKMSLLYFNYIGHLCQASAAERSGSRDIDQFKGV